MKLTLITFFCFLTCYNVMAQNHFTSKMAIGIHFNARTEGDKKFTTGVYFSGYAEPKISKSGNLVFNIDYGIFKPEFQTTAGSGKYSLFAGYKQKFFSGKSDYYACAMAGAMFQSFGIKISFGNEYRILKTSFLSFDVFYCKALFNSASGDGGSSKVASLIGITFGAGIIHK